MRSSQRMCARIVTFLMVVVASSLLFAVAAAPAEARHADRNSDRLPDRWEVRHGLSLTIKQTWRDQDHDGIKNYWEFRLKLHPRHKDSDYNGTPDGSEDTDVDGVDNIDEHDCGTNPVKPDTDGDGTGDGAEDADGDGLGNGIEDPIGTDPADSDTDDNSVDDGDEDADGDGYSNEDESSSNEDPTDATEFPGDENPVGDEGETEPGDESGDDWADDCPCYSYGGYVVAFDGRYLTIMTWAGEIRQFSMWEYMTAEWYDYETGAYYQAGSWFAAFTPGATLADLDVDADSGEVVDADIAA